VRVADLIVETLEQCGATTVFTVTGGGAMHLNDAFGLNKAFEKIYCHHEQACAMAAEAYARLSGKPAVVNVTTGPGGLNALNGVFGAYTDSIPMLVVSGQVKRETLISTSELPARQIGDQEVDIISIVRQGLTKAAFQLDSPANAAAIVRKAWKIATSGRPGPVWLDVPMDIQGAPVPAEVLDQQDQHVEFLTAANTDMEQQVLSGEQLQETVTSVLSDLTQAKRPVVFAGGGIRASGMTEIYRELADLLECPFVTGWNAHDILVGDHPNNCGRPGSVGDRPGNFTVQNADYVLILGSRLNIRQISYNYEDFAKNARLCMVDIDRAELHKPTLNIDHKVHANLQEFLPELVRQVGTLSTPAPASHLDYRAWCKDRVARYPTVLAEYSANEKGPVNPYYFVEELFSRLPSASNIVCGDGTACVVTFQAAIIKQNTRLFSNSGSASMGYDLPAALGVAIATGERTWCIAGDGSIMMNIQELQTLSSKKLDVVIIILNNDGYHSIRQTQQNYFPENIAGCGPDSGLEFPRFESVAGAFGFEYQRIDTNGDVFAGLDQLVKTRGPVICEVMLDKAQDFAPKLKSRQLADGTMVTGDFIDLWPFLPADELKQNIIDDE
jgi:acetolactate synthase I/II/III large subunit